MGFSVDTLASGVVEVRNSADGIWTPESQWRLVEEFRLGAVDGGGPEMFGSVADIEIDRLGRIYVADEQSEEIRVFGPDGQFVRTLGARGAGPGEFGQLNALEWDREGNLWILDFGNRRWTVYDTSGVFLRSQPRSQTFLIQPWPGGFDREGRLIDPIDQGLLVRHLPGSEDVDTLSLELDPIENFELRSESSRTTVRIPFAPGPVWHLDRDGYVWYGFNSSFSIARRSLEGDTLLLMSRDFDPVAVSSEELDQSLQWLEGFAAQGMEIDRSRIPATRPAYDAFVADARGNLWVFTVEVDLSGGNPIVALRSFDLFDRGGVYQGKVELPTDLHPVVFPRITENRLIGVSLDQLGVPYVVSFRIEEAP